MLLSEEVNPASYDYPEEWFASELGKGQEDPYQGNDILYNAGGSDTYGYYWIDSDETGGPQFDWVDIQLQGTEITGFSDDNFVGPFPIGFTFNYYGNDYTEYYVSSNGFCCTWNKFKIVFGVSGIFISLLFITVCVFGV